MTVLTASTKALKALMMVLVIGMFLTSVAMADDAHDVDSTSGKSGYLTETFFLFPMNSNKQLLQWYSDLGQVTSRKSPSDRLFPLTLKLPRHVQQPELAQLGTAIVPFPLASRDFRFVQLRNNSSVSPSPSEYSFPTASMATFPLPQGTPPQSSPPPPKRTFDLRSGLVGGALIGVGVYLMATSEKELMREGSSNSFIPDCLFCLPCTSEDQPGCGFHYDWRMVGGGFSTVMGGVMLLLAFF